MVVLLLSFCSVFSQNSEFEKSLMESANVKSVRQYHVVVDKEEEKTLLAPDRCLQLQWNFNQAGQLNRKLFFGCTNIVEQEQVMIYKNGKKVAEQWIGYTDGKKDTLKGKMLAYQYYLDGRLKAQISRNRDFSESARNEWTYTIQDSVATKATFKCGICPEYRTYIYRYNTKGQLKRIMIKNVENNELGNVSFVYNYKNQLIGKRLKTKEGLNETILEPDESELTYNYDEEGHLIAKSEVHLLSEDFRKKTTYEYNEKGLLIRENVYLAPNRLSFYNLYEYDFYR